MQNFDANSTKVTEGSTNERTYIRTDAWKDENYIPVGINTGGIINIQVADMFSNTGVTLNSSEKTN